MVTRREKGWVLNTQQKRYWSFLYNCYRLAKESQRVFLGLFLWWGFWLLLSLLPGESGVWLLVDTVAFLVLLVVSVVGVLAMKLLAGLATRAYQRDLAPLVRQERWLAEQAFVRTCQANSKRLMENRWWRQPKRA